MKQFSAVQTLRIPPPQKNEQTNFPTLQITKYRSIILIMNIHSQYPVYPKIICVY